MLSGDVTCNSELWTILAGCLVADTLKMMRSLLRYRNMSECHLEED